ncbi:translation elongation factor Ts [Candidatus Curtissbacteria bacterium RIFCSPHIGHO2_01_FULL_41_44]|uniref:Elongation factor Ts n=1 Tax=Candidatus Curtissbacteria bacterium RIFCSPLOWO2_01_FULL_42_50 TaxID=1797730 RepID=A0A1F5H769_9BACT|nr:MAG: translation elongation factor Ts [Candidatus Curtissbacteria bacterium RIFCSPHIGHO2_02_FULL_42_58]OGD94410.1 MAG: translation elongation factor Ts [Candidatus Curtissbacteria bacterium RIFCSPHIGHO2_01_FULL_41_44]OGD97684.1 MAG: translation elongation factor Ts [Candidatus Curtissbacteria bacterium RIFCSPHIGHO2_12_FULL_42_33]OGD99915.1 MAG: translation elongation factor Ts [Candidatus Curtissbacteria bacterium RIFCSPLOWO2_01_FULL_42_50]OGE02774.1 MAG: translation elongation factor Ts [Ca
MTVSIGDIKKLREKTSAGIVDCRRALEETGGDFKKAEELVKSWGFDKAAAKEGRVVGAGLVETYIHAGGKVGAMVEVNCETDFVARTDEFKTLAHELAMQVAAMDPASVEKLLKQEYIRDSAKTIDQLVKETIAKVGENIVTRRFMRFELGA